MEKKRSFKITKTLSGAQTYRGWKDYSEGDVVIGQFIGIHVDQYKKENVKLLVLDAQFKDGSGEALEGKVLVLNHCGSLEHAMAEVSEGEYVQVEYTGKITLSKGPYAGKEAHTVAVAVVEIDNDATPAAGNAHDSL